MNYKKIFRNVTLGILLFWGTAMTSKVNQSDKGIDDLFYKLFESEASRKPQELTRFGYFETQGSYSHNAFLNDVSPKAKTLELEGKKKNLRLLKQYPLDNLSSEQKINYKIIRWGLENAIRGEKFLFHEYYMSHEFGILSLLTEVFVEFHPLKNRKLLDFYLLRLKRIAGQLEQSIALLEHQKKIGVVPPAFCLSYVIEMIQELMPKSIEKNEFYVRLARTLETIETQNKEEILAKAENIIKTSVYPAFKKLLRYLQQLRSQTTANNGVWALPNGDEYYAYKLKRHTTTDLTADQIHELGIKEVKKVHAEMRGVFRKAHLNDDKKSIAQLTNKLLSLFKFSFFKEHYLPTENSRKQCLADYNAILERSRKKLSHLFDLKPKSSVKIKAVPSYEENTAVKTPHYVIPNIDGSRPGVFFVNLGWKGLLITPTFIMESSVIHEAEPGHHLQLSLQQESNIPLLRKFETDEAYTAYVEGWALYVEKLAYEQGFYSSERSKLGHLGFELLRAARLVVDTGIHKKKWTKEKAINYMIETTGFPKILIEDEVERYFVDPGQACAYKIGQLKILELRERAKKTLGEKFDIREFHNVILKTAESPLPILEEVVDQYIQDKFKTEGGELS